MARDDLSPGDEFRASYEEHAQKVGRFNLAIFGKTGVGKSTLINSVFGEDVAPTGVGEPVTMDRHLYMHNAAFFGLLDTRGLEIGVDTKAIIRELSEYVESMRKKPESEQIHVAWYCVRATDGRFEETEAEFIRKLHDLGLPVIVVLTQVSSRNGEFHPDAMQLASHIRELGMPIAGGHPIPVMAQGDDFTDQQPHGLHELLDATFRAAPEGVERALLAAQKVDVERKWKAAQDMIVAAGAAAAVVGAVPIPIADAALLVPIQLGLMGRVSAIYGIKIEMASMAATLATAVATQAGRGLVIGLLKLIPGAGTIVGGAISGVTASAFTLAMGFAWATVCSQLSLGKLHAVDGALDGDALQKLFKSELSSWFGKLRSKTPEFTTDPAPQTPETTAR